MPSPSAFSGELGLVGLFDLGQLLMLNGATGCLSITDGARKGFLYFRDGRVINAVDEDFREGEVAAYHVFMWRSGKFEFRPDPPSGDGLIEVGTEALMLEAARQMDEAGIGGDGAGEATNRLRERQGSMEALREAFTSVAREARGLSPVVAASGSGTHVDALRMPGDRMLFRPGRPARLRTRGAWREAQDAALSAADYEDLRARLLGADGLEGPTDGVRRAVSRFPDGRVIEVSLVPGADGESLWLRPADLRPALIEGSPERLAAAFAAPRALVLVGGSDPDEASRLLHALVAWRLGCGDAVAIATDHPTWRHEEGPGALVTAGGTQLGAALAAMEPAVLALDLSRAAAEGALEALDAVRHVLARVPGDTADALLARWTERLAPADARRVTAHLEGADTLCLIARPAATDERVAFDLLGPASGTRERATLEDAAALAAELGGRRRKAA